MQDLRLLQQALSYPAPRAILPPDLQLDDHQAAKCGHPSERSPATENKKYCSVTCAIGRRLANLDRARRGYEMRCAGMAWREIAETLGLTTNARES